MLGEIGGHSGELFTWEDLTKPKTPPATPAPATPAPGTPVPATPAAGTPSPDDPGADASAERPDPQALRSDDSCPGYARARDPTEPHDSAAEAS